MQLPEPHELAVKTLGPCRFASPLGSQPEQFVGERSRVLVSANTEVLEPRLRSNQQLPAFEVAGPRPRIFFDTRELTCGIVTFRWLSGGASNSIHAGTYGSVSWRQPSNLAAWLE